MIAHGGVGGAVVEIFVLVAVAGVFLAVWLRERGEGEVSPPTETLRGEDEEHR